MYVTTIYRCMLKGKYYTEMSSSHALLGNTTDVLTTPSSTSALSLGKYYDIVVTIV